MFPTSQSEAADLNEMPTWEEFISPTLRAMSDGVTRTRRELYPVVADEAQLSEAQRLVPLASGQLLYANRIGWGLSLLAKTGALARPTRGSYAITDAGLNLLAAFPERVTQKQVTELTEDPSSGLKPYVPTTRSVQDRDVSTPLQTTLTPIELIDVGMEQIVEELSADLLGRLVEKDPYFFEEAVVKLLIGMGYGGELGKGWATRKSNDGGIDGVIDQDLLGLNKVYIQAKRYGLGSSPVGRPEIQSFVGALSGKADSGVFITTGRFSAGAIEYVENVPTRVVLVDGEQLARLMIRFHVGVQETRVISMVEIDEDFFS